MARLYHVDIATHAAQADSKWVDNLLSHFSVPGVEGGRQGSARRISEHGIHHVALVWSLTRDLGIPIQSAVSVAGRLLSTGEVRGLGPGWVTLVFDREAFVRDVDRLVADGVESVTPVRRGRPPTVRV